MASGRKNICAFESVHRFRGGEDTRQQYILSTIIEEKRRSEKPVEGIILTMKLSGSVLNAFVELTPWLGHEKGVKKSYGVRVICRIRDLMDRDGNLSAALSEKLNHFTWPCINGRIKNEIQLNV